MIMSSQTTESERTSQVLEKWVWGVFTNIRTSLLWNPVKTELQGKMYRLNRLMNINFSSHDVLKANFSGHAMRDGGGGDTSYRGLWSR